MELFYGVFGIAMIYAWVHSIVIISTKTKGTTAYEKFLMIASAVTLGLYIIGTIA